MRADGQAASTQVQRQRRCDLGPDAIRHRNAHHHARALAHVEVFGEQVRRNRRQDVLDGAVLVEVSGNPERSQLVHLIHARHRAAEDQDGQVPLIELADAPHQVDPRRVGHLEVEHDQINLGQIDTHVCEQLRHAPDNHGAVARGI